MKFRRDNDILTTSLNEKEFKIISCAELSEKANYLYNAIRDISASRKISVQDNIESKDSIDHAVFTEGFSIKSHIGDPSILFNSASNSELLYEIKNCNDEMMEKINSIESESGMLRFIRDDCMLDLELVGSKSPEYAENVLQIIIKTNKILLKMTFNLSRKLT